MTNYRKSLMLQRRNLTLVDMLSRALDLLITTQDQSQESERRALELEAEVTQLRRRLARPTR